MSSGSKPVTTIGTPYFSASGVLAGAHHAADVPAARNACTRHVGDSMIAAIAGGTSTCETSSEKFGRPAGGLVDGHRVGRRGGLEADAEEHHLLSGFSGPA
jgi:hypothetical protein